MQEESQLCASCRLFDLHSFSRDSSGYRGYRWQKILEGAYAGCRFCSLLKGCFECRLPDSKFSAKSFVHLRLDRDVDKLVRNSQQKRHDQATHIDEESWIGSLDPWMQGVDLPDWRSSDGQQESHLLGSRASGDNSAAQYTPDIEGEQAMPLLPVETLSKGLLRVKGICAEVGGPLAKEVDRNFPDFNIERSNEVYLSVIADPGRFHPHQHGRSSCLHESMQKVKLRNQRTS